MHVFLNALGIYTSRIHDTSHAAYYVYYTVRISPSPGKWGVISSELNLSNLRQHDSMRTGPNPLKLHSLTVLTQRNKGSRE